MTLKARAIVEELHAYLSMLYAERLVHIIVFGSQARNEAQADSDIDIMIVLKGDVDPFDEIHNVSEFRAELCLQNDVIVSCIFVSEEQYLHEQSPLLLNVRREGIAA